MAVERFIMAEGGSTPEIGNAVQGAVAEPNVVVKPETASLSMLSRFFRREPKIEVLVSPPKATRAPEFDPKREDYTSNQEGKYTVYTDPATGKEVAKIPRIEGGAPKTSEELVKESEKDPAKAQYWMGTLQKLHLLPAPERETRRDEYEETCRQLAIFAHDNKLFGNSETITFLEKQLTDFEKKEIEKNNRPEAEQGILQDQLNNLTALESELEKVNNDWKLKKDAPDFFTETKWNEIEKRKEQLPAVIDQLRADLIGKVSADFFSDRDKLKESIDEAIKKVEVKAEEDRQQQLDEQLGDPDEDEKKLEEKLIKEEDKESPPTRPLLPTFAGELALFNTTKNPEGIIRFFHEARSLGVVSDLEERFNGKYLEWATALTPHREVSPFDRYGERSGRITRKTFSEIQDEIIEYFNNLLDPSKSQYVEQGARWNFLERRGLTTQNRLAMQGLRVEFVRGVQVQIEDSLSGLTSISRISGGWNVHRMEREIRSMREKQEIQERTRPLFQQESYYRIVLLGKNREEIERGADQAAESIIQSSTTFSLDVVRQRMEQLMTAIKETQSILQANETDGTISEKDATDRVKEIQHTYSNKLDFYILGWTSDNLLMDQFSGYYSDRMRMAGTDKLKLIPAGHDGLDGLAIHWLMSPEFRLYHRPQGFKGQLYDDDQTHKVMRKLMKEQIVKRLMEYDLNGKDSREKAENRKILKNGPSIHEFLQQFDHKGIPSGVIPEWLISGYESGINNPTEFFNDLSSESRLHLYSLLLPEQREQLFAYLRPDYRVEMRRFQYKNKILEKNKKAVVTFKDLEEIRVARKMLADEQTWYQAAKSKAESAFDTADKVLTIFGEAAFLNAPSIVMDNGDYISVPDNVLIYKHAILQAAKGHELTGSDGNRYIVDDNLALIRHRSKAWIKKATRTGYDRSKAGRDIIIDLPKDSEGNPIKVTFTLAAGFEETGLTEKEFMALKTADQMLRTNGYLYTAESDMKTFEEIIKMDELQPVLNNVLVDYKSSMSEINDPNVIERAARGRFASIANIRKRLGFAGRQRSEGTTQLEIDDYTDKVEDSRSFDAEVERLVYFLATHDLNKPLRTATNQPIIERGKPLYDFSANRVDYGYERSWGVKRLHHLKAFWYSRLRRTVPRGVDLVHALPFTLTALSRELAFDNFLQMCWDIDKMESIDNPILVMMGDRHKDMVYLRGRGEGSVSEGQGRLDKDWGWFEKWLVDANGLWKAIAGKLPGVATIETLKALLDDPTKFGGDASEQLVDAVMEALGRFKPLLTGTEKLLGEDRQALSAGSGHEENAKIIFRFSEWLLSEKGSEKGSDERQQGGLEVQKEIADIIRLLMKPGTFAPGRKPQMNKDGKPIFIRGTDRPAFIPEESPSIWEEAMRKLTPGHNPRLPALSIPPATIH